MKIGLFYKFLLSFVVLVHVTTILCIQKCHLCSKNFNQNNQLVNIDHLIKKHLQCPWCNTQPFSEKIDLLKHVEAHHRNEKVYSCPNCLLLTTRPYEARRHIGLVHKKSRITIKCYPELRVFFNNILPKIYINYCSDCKQAFSSENQINRHFLHKHNIWLYGIKKVINAGDLDNALGIDLQSLKNPSSNNNDNNNNISTTSVTLENSDNYQCTACKNYFIDPNVFLEHLSECLPLPAPKTDF